MNAESSPARFQELDAEYEILGELGRGGTAIVYRARERELGREVAIKVVRGTHVDDAEAVARLAREAKLVAALRHPNIVPLLSVRHLSDGLALVMQHVPGRTLKRAIRECGPLPIALVEQVLREVAAALDYAHKRHGVVHRDIKPENIYLDEEVGRALLADFGIARTEGDSTLTLVGTALGTPAYMSPEQIDGTALDGRSDLYSLGLVAYEMLTGQQPWAGHNLYKGCPRVSAACRGRAAQKRGSRALCGRRAAPGAASDLGSRAARFQHPCRGAVRTRSGRCG
jgi:serine/threonine protein kinase